MGKEKMTEIGLERQCTKCHDWWPATREFFYATGRADHPKLHSWCKACYEEGRKDKRAASRRLQTGPQD